MGHSEDDTIHKYLIKWKRIGRISWKFRYWFDLRSSIELDIKRLMLNLSNAPLTVIFYVKFPNDLREFHSANLLCPNFKSHMKIESIHNNFF